MMTGPEELIVLRSKAGDAELILAPAIGGSVAAYRIGGEDVLRPASNEALEARDPRGFAAFPLFPFSGRIENGRIQMGDREISLELNFLPEPHAIHGHAWQSPWRVSAQGSDSITLDFDYGGGDWPWAYRARQVFVLGTDDLSLTLSLSNRGETNMPGGLGWHPYFPKEGAVLSANVQTLWRSEENGIPVQPSPLDAACDLRKPRSVAALDLDNAFKVGGGPSQLAWPGRRLKATLDASDSLGHLVVFTPVAQDYFCVEPVSHAPNAINSPLPPEITGLRVLAPGETMSASLRIVWTRS
jgi:aldose 1-epimerase